MDTKRPADSTTMEILSRTAEPSALYVGFISKSKGEGLEGCGTDGYGDLLQEC